MLGWIRPKDTPLPAQYRVNLIIKDPEVIALLVRGAPHGKITSTLLHLMRHGYDRMVANKELVPSDFLTAEEMDSLKPGKRVGRRATRDTTPTAPQAPTPPPPAPAAGNAPPTGPAQQPRAATAPPPAPAAQPQAPAPAAGPPEFLIDEGAANVLLNARG